MHAAMENAVFRKYVIQSNPWVAKCVRCGRAGHLTVWRDAAKVALEAIDGLGEISVHLGRIPDYAWGI